jgi:hypothetical protein
MYEFDSRCLKTGQGWAAFLAGRRREPILNWHLLCLSFGGQIYEDNSSYNNRIDRNFVRVGAFAHGITHRLSAYGRFC